MRHRSSASDDTGAHAAPVTRAWWRLSAPLAFTVVLGVVLASLGIGALLTGRLDQTRRAVEVPPSASSPAAQAGRATSPSATPTGPSSAAPSAQRTIQGTVFSPAPKEKPKPRARTARPTSEETCVPTDAETELTVVAYNIKSARGGSKMGAIVGELSAWGADVVLLQEVDDERNTSRNIDMPAYLGSKLGMYHAFGSNVTYGGGSYGTAILSRFPITSSSNTHLPNGPNGQRRGLLRATIDVDGVSMSVYSTHLQNIYESIRIKQIRAINGILAGDPLPKVIGGDFNAHPTSPVMRIARAQLVDSWTAGVGPGYTHPATHPQGRIDYLLHADGPVPLSSDVMRTSFSDHNAVRTTYRVGSSREVCVPVID